MPKTLQPSSASGTAFLPAPQPRSSTRALPARRSSSVVKPIRTAFGGDCAKPATMSGAFHGEGA